MGKLFENNQMGIPESSHKEGCLLDPLPYFLLGDKIFALKAWPMKPYQGTLTHDQRNFNYRLSRGRRTIENALGILPARWRLFRKAIQASAENVQRYTMACVCLHNYHCQTDNARYLSTGFVDCENSLGNIKPGEWRTIVQMDGCNGLLAMGARRHGRTGNLSMEMRDALKDYFVSNEGKLDWQEEYINRCGPVLENWTKELHLSIFDFISLN